MAASQQALVTSDGAIVSLRWIVDRDRKLKLTLCDCGACHTRVLKDGTSIVGAQGNLHFNLSIFPTRCHRCAACGIGTHSNIRGSMQSLEEWFDSVRWPRTTTRRDSIRLT